MLIHRKSMFDFDFPSLSNTQYEEDDKGLTFKFNLAGTKKSDLQINLENGRYINVTANGIRKYVALVPKEMDIEKSSAAYNDGMLEVFFPKNVPKKKTIPIN